LWAKIFVMEKSDRTAQMRELVNRWEASGQSQKEFASENNLNLHTFKYWLYKFRRDDQSPEGFIRLGDIPAPEICLRYPSGVELIIPTNTPAAVLIDLIRIAG
jgi:hypothetical protein